MTTKCDNNGCIGGKAYRTDESVLYDPTKEFCSFDCANEYVRKMTSSRIQYGDVAELLHDPEMGYGELLQRIMWNCIEDEFIEYVIDSCKDEEIWGDDKWSQVVEIIGYFFEYENDWYKFKGWQKTKQQRKILNKEFLEVVECSYDTWVSSMPEFCCIGLNDTDFLDEVGLNLAVMTRSEAILDQLRPEKGGFISHEEFEEKMKSGEYLRPRKRARETNL